VAANSDQQRSASGPTPDGAPAASRQLPANTNQPLAEAEATARPPAAARLASVGGWLIDGLGWLVSNLLDGLG